jgi:RNA polymerase sigma-70 factor (ECF subfamily)
MDELTRQFEAHRRRLHALAYRMLGSLTEADDVVQEAWLRVSKAGADEVANFGGWLTTITARICLNMLRSRRREEPLDSHVPDAIVDAHPEDDAVRADSVGLAMLVVLDTLNPAERVAYVLHDMFDVPFDEIASMVDRTPTAARQLASRARRRVQGAAVPDSDLTRQRGVIDAFLAAAREGDFTALVSVLDPAAELRIDGVGAMHVRGADALARQSLKGLSSVLSRPSIRLEPVLVNGAAGVLVSVNDRPVTIMGFTMSGDLIVEIDSIADPERVLRLLGQ